MTAASCCHAQVSCGRALTHLFDLCFYLPQVTVDPERRLLLRDAYASDKVGIFMFAVDHALCYFRLEVSSERRSFLPRFFFPGGSREMGNCWFVLVFCNGVGYEIRFRTRETSLRVFAGAVRGNSWVNAAVLSGTFKTKMNTSNSVQR